ncbi:MAG: MarR family winged helix-turn-helix transcriptional regulator [Candidatus Dormibacteria bacterium]
MSRTGSVPVTPASPQAVHDGMEISRLYGEMWRRFQPQRQVISGSAVTPRMLSYLRHLAAAGPLTVGEQASHLGISYATATEVVNRLEAKGLVERMKDDGDQRRVFVWLTDRGREQTAALAGRNLEDPFLHAVAALPAATRAAIIEGLGALLRAADAGSHTPDKEEES